MLKCTRVSSRRRFTKNAGEPKHTATRRLQAVLIAFFLCATLSLLAVYRVQPAIYTQELGGAARYGWMLLLLLLAVEAVLTVGMLRRWRWLVWLLVVAFASSLLRVPLLALRLAGLAGGSEPLWYDLVRALVGLVQGAIAVWMLRLYRRYGVWACRRAPEDAAPA